jgi:rhomboid protease GluP
LFIRRESFDQFLRFYPVVCWIIGINTALYILSNLPIIGQEIVGLGIGFNAAVAQGEYWRLLTPVFLHSGSNIMHFLFNSFALIIFAPALETILGRIKFLLLYLGAGIIGNIGTFIFGGLGYGFHLGASGAIYGLLGAYLYMMLFRERLIDSGSRQVLTVIMIVGALYSFLPGINLYAHFVGFAGGLLLAPLMFLGKTQPFSVIYTAGYRSKDEDYHGFDPNRWQKKRRRQKRLKWIGIGIIVLLVLSYLLNGLYY